MEKNSTRRLKTMIGATIALAVMALLAPRPAQALTEHEASVKALAAASVSRTISTGATEAVAPGWGMTAINLLYVGSSTEAVITITSGTLLAHAPGGTPDATFSNGSAHSIDLLNGSYDTIGEVCDAINNGSNYQCFMRDARRNDSSKLLYDQTLANGSNNLKDSGGYDVAFDSGGTDNTGYRYVGFFSLGISPAPGKRVILKNCDFNVASDGVTLTTVSVSGVLKKYSGAVDGVTRDDATVVWAQNLSTATATTLNFTDTGLGGIEFAKASASPTPQHLNASRSRDPGRVVIRANSDNANANPQTPTSYLRCRWDEE